jgi:tetratricopeptide (TPR) repeat protein
LANKEKLVESAQKYLAKGLLSKAIGEYQKLVEAFPRDYRNRQKLAELLTREKRHEEARPHYEAVARNFTETGFYLKAIAIYKQMQKVEPERSEFYLRLAELYEKHGLIGNALNEYRSLVAYYDRHHQPREALGTLHKMVALEPGNPGVRGQLIEKLVAQGGQEEALEQFMAMIGLLDDRGEYANIVRFFDKFGHLCRDDNASRLAYAKALLLSGEAGRALPLLADFQGEAPGHPQVLSLLSDCHLALGHFTEACRACRQLLATQPGNLGLRERYLRLCIEAGDARQALDSLASWQADFIVAERLGVFQELCDAVQAAWPDDVRMRAEVAALLAAVKAGPAETGVEPSAAAADVETPGPVEAAPASHSGVIPPDVAPPPASPDAVTDAIPATAERADELLADELLADMELEFELDAFEVLSPVEAAPLEPDAPVIPAVDGPPCTSLVLPEFCELDFDLELTDEEPDPVVAPAVEPDDFIGLHGLFAEPAAARIDAGPQAAAGGFTASDDNSCDEDAQSHFDLGIAFK